jgi:O-antigen/teichoic acid export membrane protein
MTPISVLDLNPAKPQSLTPDPTPPGDPKADELGARAARGSLWLGLVNLVSKGSQMAVTFALAAFLSQSELGLITIAVSLVNVAQVIQAMGVYDVIARTDRDEDEMAGTVLTMSVAIATMMGIIGVVAATPIATVLGASEAAPLVMIVSLSLPFSAVGGVQMALMHRSLDFKKRILPDAGSAIIGACVTIALAAGGSGAYSLAFGLLCTAILQPIFGYVVGTKVRPQWHPEAAAEAIRWIRIVGPAAVVATILVNVDYPMISRVLGPDAVGVYSVAFRIAWVPFIMAAVVFGAVSFPFYTALIRDRREDELPQAVSRFTHVVLLLVGGTYLIIALLADRITLLGERWQPAAAVLVVLCVYGLGISLLETWYEALKAVGRIHRYLVIEVAHLVILVGLLLVVTERGVVAVAYAQLAAAWCLVPFAWYSMVVAGVAPPLRAVIRILFGVLLPAASAIGVEMTLRAVGLHDSPAVIDAILEGALVTSTFVAVAVLANRPLIDKMRSMRTREAV